MINLWLKEQDKRLFEELSGTSLNPYRDQILTGVLNNSGVLGKIGKRFVLGKEGVWIPKGTDQKYHFVRIDNSSAYPEGLILTPYSDIDLRFHLGSRTVDKVTRFSRVELHGMDTDDFVIWVFHTYDGPLVYKRGDKDPHLLLYSTYGQHPSQPTM
jgi:hypothetical protein